MIQDEEVILFFLNHLILSKSNTPITWESEAERSQNSGEPLLHNETI
jgi:hypothetical protein